MVEIKPLTEKYLKEKRIKSWKLINNGILEYGQYVADKVSNEFQDQIEKDHKELMERIEKLESLTQEVYTGVNRNIKVFDKILQKK